MGGFTHNSAFLAVREFKMAGSAELVDLAETEGSGREPTKAMKFSSQVTQCFNIIRFLEIFRSFEGNFRGEAGDFLGHFWINSGKILRPFFPRWGLTLCSAALSC